MQPVASLRVPFPTAGAGPARGGGHPQYDAGSKANPCTRVEKNRHEAPGVSGRSRPRLAFASLGAHTALYGSSHEMGGAFHSELVTVGRSGSWAACSWPSGVSSRLDRFPARRRRQRSGGPVDRTPAGPGPRARRYRPVLHPRGTPRNPAPCRDRTLAVGRGDRRLGRTASGSGPSGNQDAGRCHRRHLAPGLPRRARHSGCAAPRAGFRRRALAPSAAPALRPSSSDRERPEARESASPHLNSHRLRPEEDPCPVFLRRRSPLS